MLFNLGEFQLQKLSDVNEVVFRLFANSFLPCIFSSQMPSAHLQEYVSRAAVLPAPQEQLGLIDKLKRSFGSWDSSSNFGLVEPLVAMETQMNDAVFARTDFDFAAMLQVESVLEPNVYTLGQLCDPASWNESLGYSVGRAQILLGEVGNYQVVLCRLPDGIYFIVRIFSCALHDYLNSQLQLESTDNSPVIILCYKARDDSSGLFDLSVLPGFEEEQSKVFAMDMKLYNVIGFLHKLYESIPKGPGHRIVGRLSRPIF